MRIREHHRAEVRRPRIRWYFHIGVTVAVVFVWLVLVVHDHKGDWGDASRHALEGLAIVLVIHVLHSLLLAGDIEKQTEFFLNRALNRTSELTQQANSAGLEKIARSRLDLTDEIKEGIPKAREEVFVLGITLSHGLQLRSLLPTLAQHAAKGEVDVRVLMLDPLRSTSVSRDILEAPKDAGAFLDVKDRSRRVREFFKMSHFKDFEAEFAAADQKDYRVLRQSIRFYRDAPTAWLVLIDDRVYYQPYAFANEANVASGERIVEPLPVLCFRRDTHADRPCFDGIRTYFLKIWESSTVDMFHMSHRLADKDRILERVLDERENLMRDVLGAVQYSTKLSGATTQSRRPRVNPRLYPHRLPEPAAEFGWLTWRNGSTTERVRATVRDISCEGLRASLAAPLPAGVTHVSIEMDATFAATSGIFRSTVNAIEELRDVATELAVVRTNKDRTSVAIRSYQHGVAAPVDFTLPATDEHPIVS
jgi:hypothetical protein